MCGFVPVSLSNLTFFINFINYYNNSIITILFYYIIFSKNGSNVGKKFHVKNAEKIVLNQGGGFSSRLTTVNRALEGCWI